MRLRDRRYTLDVSMGLRGEAPATGPRTTQKRFEWTLSDEALEELVDLIPNPPGTDRDTWIAVLHGIAGAGGAFETWDGWSSRWDGYDAADTRRAWDTLVDTSVRSGGGLLRQMAEKADPGGFGAWKLKHEAKVVFADEAAAAAEATTMFTVDDFRSIVGEAEFIHVGTGRLWKPVSVDAKVAAVPVGQKEMKATAWMRRHRYVTELSWLPGKGRIIENRSVGVMGLEVRPMHSIFNLYLAPPVVEVGEIDAEPWLGLVRRLWPGEAEEIFDWFAHRVQKPGEKCNHALVLGGAPGIGKDTVLEAVRRAVGVANCNEIMPSDLRGNFNDYVKSVMLVINELRDDGGLSQYAFYDKSKTLIAAPPYVMTINSKYLKQYTVPNVCGVVMTSNYKQTGLYLPADDRRHLVAWSDEPAVKEGDKTFPMLWKWLEGGGFNHVAAWLRGRDLRGFDAKATPRKTKAFLDIVAAAGSVEEKALGDKIEELGVPEVLRTKDLKSGAFDGNGAGAGLDDFLNDPKYRRVVAEALGRAGYDRVVNPRRQDGRWIVQGQHENIYGRRDKNTDYLLDSVRKLVEAEGKKPGNA